MELERRSPSQRRAADVVETMSRGEHTFKQADVTKAVKGAAKAGLNVTRVEIEGKKIVVFADRFPPSITANDENEWDGVQ